MQEASSFSRALKRILTALLAIVMIAGTVGYAVFRIQTPVSLDQAIERFQAGNDGSTSERYEVNPTRGLKNQDAPRTGRPKAGGNRSSDKQPDISTPVATAAEAAVSQVAAHFDVMPAEGVYTYVGRGRESIYPVPPRNFERVTHRIITHEDADTWIEHHIFSEERASWTKITTSETGRLAHYQRNYIKMGVEETRTFPFNPPIQAVIFPYRLGQNWDGRFTGRTEKDEDYTGTYTVKNIDDSVWEIGGVRVRVLGFDFFVDLKGEFNGTVRVKYWFAPRYGVTVREEYYADAQVGPIKYWGEWFVKLRSLKPAA